MMERQKTAPMSSFSGKIIALAIAIFFTVTLVLAVLLIYLETNFIEHNFHHSGQDMLAGIREASRIAILAEDVGRLEQIAAENMAQRREILYLVFYGSSGKKIFGVARDDQADILLDRASRLDPQRIFYDDAQLGEGVSYRNLEKELNGRVVEYRALFRSSEPGDLDMFAGSTAERPAPGGGQVSGYLRLGVSTKELREITGRIITDTAVAGMAALLVMGVVTVLMMKRLTAPLSELVAGVQAVAEGEMDKTIVVRSADEVGRLATEFNQMVVALNDRQRLLQESEARYRTLFERIHYGILLFDSEGFIVDSNPAMVHMLGFQEVKELGGTPIVNIFKEQSEFERLMELVASEGTVHDLNMSLRRLDGTDVETTVSITGQRQYKGTSYCEVVVVDVTKIMELERRLLQAHKMEAVGTLAGGVAHDFNNILTGITGYADLLTMTPEVTSNRELGGYVLAIQQSAKRAADLVKQLLGFARKGLYQEELVKLNNVAREVHGLLTETVDRRIAVSLELAADLWLIRGDESQIYQTLLNICLNSCDAMPEGGILRISTANLVNPQGMKVVGGVMPAGSYVLLRVVDTGTGMAAETIDKMFEPFYTTKQFGKGTGLGMAMVHGIVANHHGFIKVDSAVGQGTTITIFLPGAGDVRAAGENGAGEPVAVSPATGGATILLVDDEEVIRNVVGRFFEQMVGFTLLTAASGEEALEILTARHAEVDLVVLDISMPGMGGHKAFAVMHERYPQLPVIIATGYARDATVARLIEQGAAQLVLKPYTGKELLQAVKGFLERRRADASEK